MGVYFTTRLISSTDICPSFLKSKRTALRPVVHAQARPYDRPLLFHISYHPCAHSLTVSPRSVVSIPAKGPSSPSIPSISTPLCRPTPSRDAAAHVRSNTDTKMETWRLRRRLGPIFRVRARVLFFGSARFHRKRIFPFDMPPRHFYLHTQLRLTSLYFSRVSRTFQDAAVSRPELQRIADACEAGTESVQCAVICSSRESPVVFCMRRDTDSCNRVILTYSNSMTWRTIR